MHGPGKESTIKRLLLNDKLENRIDGLTQLIEEYEDATCRIIRANYEWLPAEDLAEIWSDTTFAVWRNVQRRTFRDDGSLLSYLCKIATRKVISRIRLKAWQRIRAERGGDFLEGDQQSANLTLDSIDEILEEIRSAFDSLNEDDQLLMRIDVYLAVQAGFKRVSLDELTEEYNRRTGQDLPKTTIRSRRARARERLRRLLEERGNQQ